VYVNQTIDKGTSICQFTRPNSSRFRGRFSPGPQCQSTILTNREQGRNLELISLRGWIQDDINSRQADAFANFWYRLTPNRLKTELKLMKSSVVWTANRWKRPQRPSTDWPKLSRVNSSSPEITLEMLW